MRVTAEEVVVGVQSLFSGLVFFLDDRKKGATRTCVLTKVFFFCLYFGMTLDRKFSPPFPPKKKHLCWCGIGKHER